MPDLTQSISILSYDHFFFHFHSFGGTKTKLVRIAFARSYAFLVGPFAFAGHITSTCTALIRELFFLWFSKEIARGAVRVI